MRLASEMAEIFKSCLFGIVGVVQLAHMEIEGVSKGEKHVGNHCSEAVTFMGKPQQGSVIRVYCSGVRHKERLFYSLL